MGGGCVQSLIARFVATSVLLLCSASHAFALYEVEPPLSVLHNAPLVGYAISDVTPGSSPVLPWSRNRSWIPPFSPSAYVAVGLSRISGDGFWSNTGDLTSDTHTIHQTSYELTIGAWVFDWWSLAVRLQAMQRTLDFNTDTRNDIRSFGLGDSQFESLLALVHTPKRRVDFIVNWKAPTGRSEYIVPDAGINLKGSIPLGNNIHEGDIGFGFLRRFRGERVGLDWYNYAAYRIRGEGEPLWLDGVPVNHSGRGDDYGVVNSYLQVVTDAKLAILPFISVGAFHPIAPTSRNAWTAEGGLTAKTEHLLFRTGVGGPIYGKSFPSTFPSNLEQRTPILGLGIRASLTVWF